MTRSDRAIDALVTVGVIALTALAYVLSYAALRDLAAAKGEPAWAAALWPACLDVAALVAGFIAVRGRRRGQRDGYAEALAVAFAVGVVAANLAGKVSVVFSGVDLVGLAVRGTPPMTMLATWHLLVRRLAPAQPVSGAASSGSVMGADAASDAGRPLPAADAPGPSQLLLATESADAAPVERDDAADISEPSRLPAPTAEASDPTSVSAPPRRPAREVVRRLVQRRGATVTTADVVKRTGLSTRHAARLLADERGKALRVVGGEVKAG